MSEIQDFFENYAEVSISGDSKALAKFYGKNFVVVGPKESMAFANDSNFLTWLKNVHRFNVQTGLEKLVVRKVNSTKVGLHALQTTVTWGAIYAQTKNQIIDFDIHYILEKFNSEMKIILYISDEDQEQLMKEKGIIK